MTKEWTTILSERKYYALTLCRDLDEISSLVKKVLPRKKVWPAWIDTAHEIRLQVS